jgi:hypothetical protein
MRGILCTAMVLAAGAAVAQPAVIPAELASQIAALQREKAGRSEAQRKLSSRLVYEARMRRGVPVALGIQRLHTGVEVDRYGRVLLEIYGDVGEELLGEVERLGGEVVASLAARGQVRARVALDRVEQLAELAGVQRIQPADRAYTRKMDTSEGDVAHRAIDLRSAFGIDGTGVSVGVLSDGVSSLESIQDSGDLPLAVSVLPGQAGSGDEGTAMLEIIHDLAPGADLLFATAFSGQGWFADNIVALREAGADVIVDDVGYFAEAVFQDDDVAAAVDQVTASGALYFSSAGNGGNLNDDTSGVWEGDFVAGPDVNGSPAHDYGGDILNEITIDSPFVFTLHWSDPLGGSANDYDLLLTNKPATVIFSASTDIQAGAGDPFEIIGSGGNDRGKQLIVVRSSGAGRYLHLNANRGRLEYATAGQISGHAAARGALAVAAVEVRGEIGAFDGDESVQTYSSDGPRRVFYEEDGTPITPGDLSATGGEVRAKPDLTAADCVSTASPGFSTFCGTSAAAPHAAAMAALALERGGGPGIADPLDVRSALTTNALDIEAAGTDRDAGAGIVDAVLAGNDMPVPECLVDVDCDDGLFCNGAEFCSAGSCGAGTAPVCAGPTPFCDDGLDGCVECLAAGDCDDGLFCNGTEFCSAGSCGAGTAPICAGPTALCDEGLDGCVECLAAGDCDDGLFCNGAEVCSAGFCGAGTQPVCDPQAPLCDEGGDLCVECLTSADCGDGQVCGPGLICQGPPAIPSLRALPQAVLAALILGLSSIAIRCRER